MNKLYFATGNKAKSDAAKEHLKDFFEIENVKLDIIEPQTLDQEEVALCKVRQAFDLVKKPVFCEDLGLYIEKYNNFPGVLTAFVLQGIGLEEVKKLIKDKEPAFYKTTIAYKDNETEFCSQIIMKGYLTTNISKKSNATFRSMFVPKGCNCTVTDLDKKEYSELPYNKGLYEVFIKDLKKFNKI